MRIIAGEFRSRRLKVPSGNRVRPTSDRVRESIFNILASRIELDGLRVVDLYSGSGALAFEALSRGAAHATLVDRDRRSMEVSVHNAEALGVSERCIFHTEAVLGFLGRSESSVFDVAFADPPYKSTEVHDLRQAVERIIKPRGFLILEHGSGLSFHDDASLVTERAYGGTSVTFFQF